MLFFERKSDDKQIVDDTTFSNIVTEYTSVEMAAVLKVSCAKHHTHGKIRDGKQKSEREHGRFEVDKVYRTDIKFINCCVNLSYLTETLYK